MPARPTTDLVIEAITFRHGEMTMAVSPTGVRFEKVGPRGGRTVVLELTLEELAAFKLLADTATREAADRFGPRQLNPGGTS